MRKLPFPRKHGPNHDLCIRPIAQAIFNNRHRASVEIRSSERRLSLHSGLVWKGIVNGLLLKVLCFLRIFQSLLTENVEEKSWKTSS